MLVVAVVMGVATYAIVVLCSKNKKAGEKVDDGKVEKDLSETVATTSKERLGQQISALGSSSSDQEVLKTNDVDGRGGGSLA
ncbi:hypothetical protein DRF75_04290 [Ehrlichia minasensis]|uniref:Uncharacterized protein n=1 Tax=Ehrlichia minasensis TaxID=1242993 RepID=A0A4Q6I3J3_9RICK|nr:hypothetical protein [Ehrlichia minasensis]RZB12412.1 hypothetical protein DRF75_04290 [Ehrlichia minasensis]